MQKEYKRGGGLEIVCETDAQRQASEVAFQRVAAYDEEFSSGRVARLVQQVTAEAVSTEFLADGQLVFCIATAGADRLALSETLALRRNVLLGLQHLGAKLPPWGILDGVRPTKVAHRLLAAGSAPTETVRILHERYLLRPDKARRLVDIAVRQGPLLQAAARAAAIYIGVPFCPTRCAYCSFPGYQLKDEGQAREYWTVLQAEIAAVQELLAEQHIPVAAVYIGGGTPTALPDEVFDQLLATARQAFLPEGGAEFTVEAGRPETLTAKKVAAIGRNGVTRISINPQTMQEETLKRIGRNHKVQDIIDAFSLVRTQERVPVINADLIVGLPGEGREQLQSTLETLLRLQPENVTIHSLAVKRGAKLKEAQKQVEESLSAAAAEAMFEAAVLQVEQQGLQPYYLYRQKNVAGLTENIGFCRPGTACLYNVMVMEESNLIFGLGPYATTKLVDAANQRVVNLQHPKDLGTYQQKMFHLHAQRREALRQLCEAEGSTC